jgi:integrase
MRALGDDPAKGKREAREALTVASLVKEYIDAGEGRRSTATNGDYRRKASGFAFTLHDLRRTCATGCARLGASESTVSRILGHKAIAGTIAVAVSGIYDRFDRLPEIRAALTAWSDYVEALIREEEKQGDVSDFAAAASG